MTIALDRHDKFAAGFGALLAVSLLGASLSGRLALGWSEVLGFITGALGVYLTVKRSPWNFPVGLANNVFFAILFWNSRLFNDFGLQIVYFALGVWGLWVWTRGAPKNGGEILPVGRAGATQIALCLGMVPLLTLLLFRVSLHFGGSAPFWDALTTALSLVAQYLLGRKWLETWPFWIAADLIYVPLYISRGLYLTAILYAGFLLLCLWGFRSWKASYLAPPRAA